MIFEDARKTKPSKMASFSAPTELKIKNKIRIIFYKDEFLIFKEFYSFFLDFKFLSFLSIEMASVREFAFL